MELLYHKTNQIVLEIGDCFQKLSQLKQSNVDTTTLENEISEKMNLVERNCDRLDILVQKEPVLKRQSSKLKVDQLKYDITHFQNALAKYKAEKTRKLMEQKEREELLNRRFVENKASGDTSIYIDYSVQYQNSLQSANRGVDDLLYTGSSILDNLKTQKNKLKGAHRRVLDLGNTLGLSNTTIRLIERRAREDKYVLIGGIILTLIVMVLEWVKSVSVLIITWTVSTVLFIMDRIFRGILKYIKTDREKMVEQFVCVRNNPEPKAIFFTCMDSRMIPTRFTETNVGDMFIVRNAGNIIPHSQHFLDELTTNEPAALELGCVVNDIRHIIVCGHSDCKAMNLLYRLRDVEFASKDNRRISPLRAWLCTHAMSSLDKYRQLEIGGFETPLIFQSETPMRKVIAYIDPENKFTIEDKLSQVNCLQQMQNIASYGFLKKRLETHDLHIHALWFDIYTGDIYYFSRQSKRFVEINERSLPSLTEEVLKYYS